MISMVEKCFRNPDPMAKPKILDTEGARDILWYIWNRLEYTKGYIFHQGI